MLSKLISSIGQRSLKSILKLDDKVEEISKKFKNSCPLKEELKKIIIQKNTFISTLTIIKTTLNNITKTGQTLSGILTGLEVAVKVIKFLPVPIAPFTPLTVTNVLADSLDTLGGLLKNGKGTVKMIPQVFGGIIPEIDKLIQKLNLLDVALNACIESQGLTQKDLTEALLNSGQLSTSNGKWVLIEDIKYPQIIPLEIPPKIQSPSTDINGNIWEFQITQDLSNLNINVTSNENLEKSFPLFYKDFQLDIQYDPKNTFSFDSRRIKAQDSKPPNIILYNLPNNGYSFSSSVEVLINEMKFKIDNYLLGI